MVAKDLRVSISVGASTLLVRDRSSTIYSVSYSSANGNASRGVVRYRRELELERLGMGRREGRRF